VPVLPFVLLSVLTNYKNTLSVGTVSGTNDIAREGGLPLNKGLEAELSKQLSVINAVIEGNPYFILASPHDDLMTLKAFLRSEKHQYYVSFHKLVLNDKVVNEVTSALKQKKFVVVSTKDYCGLID